MVDAWTELEEFIRKEAGEPLIGKLDLTRDVDLYHDLDMNPPHIDRLLKQWAEQFNIDMTSFDLHDYYPSEKLGIGSFLAAVVKSPFSARTREMLGGHALTLGMMEEAMKKGRWQE
ncbi:DUF1493 family protein [Paraburkholderia oxyphila]|uniref:DUF1493 family protein n=1 Tax=Paraburkholderia oxyphila TaxID=614212 RepID=UPI00048396B6|nr:DUF1493 family protein [Paraburkholderia oxyphila]